jgi:hypothetical protein
MVTAGSVNDSAGRWLGLAVFVLGIVFLVLVFTLAYRDLTGAGVLGQLASPSATVAAESALRTLVIKAVLFFLMAYVGSAVAGRGIGLYAAARAADED